MALISLRVSLSVEMTVNGRHGVLGENVWEPK